MNIHDPAFALDHLRQRLLANGDEPVPSIGKKPGRLEKPLVLTAAC